MERQHRPSLLRRATLFAVLLILACGTSDAFIVEMYGVCFKSGHPRAGDTLESALAEPVADELEKLRFDIRFMAQYPNVRASIDGFTDTRECKGEACFALSRRRAQLVYDWLVAHGAPADRLTLGIGHGSTMPIDDEAKREGRARNRRTEVRIVGTEP